MNKFKTKDKAEQNVNSYANYCNVFKKYTFEDNIILNNKDILIFNADPLIYLANSNNIVCLTTHEDKFEELCRKYDNVKIVLINKENIVEETKKALKQLNMKFDYIFGNPPYDDDLHLKVADIVRLYIKDNGSCNLIEPLSAFCLKDNKYAKSFNNLFKHVRSYQIIDPKDHKFFESCNTFQDLGIIRYVNEITSFDVFNEWKRYYPEMINNIRMKIYHSNIPTIDDVRTKTLHRGIVVPLSHIGSVKGCVYKNFIYINDGMVKVLKTKKSKDKNIFEKAEYVPLNKLGKHPETGVLMKSVEQAARWHYEYYHNPILKGLDWLSHLGSARRKPSLVPYFSFETNMTENEICEKLNLTEEESTFIKQCSCKDFKQNNFKTAYYKEMLF